MLKLLCKWFNCGGGDARPAGGGKELPAVEYNGFSIHPRPRRKNGGWTTEAVIRKRGGDGGAHATREHIFIRADASPGKDEAVEFIIGKAKMFIDQQGDAIFS